MGKEIAALLTDEERRQLVALSAMVVGLGDYARAMLPIALLFAALQLVSHAA